MQQIGRIAIDPTNANVVYVAAFGHAWGPNKERGVYKTTDGGNTWTLVKFINDHTGFIDIQMDPADHNTLLASSWEAYRTPYSLESGGPGSGLWKTTDGGATWTEINGGGFPTTTKGRISVRYAPSDPRIVYALVEADTARNPVKNKSATGRQVRPSGLYRSADGGATWSHMNSNDVRPFYYSQVRVDPKDPNRVYWSSTPVNFSDDGGKTVRNATVGIHVDHHAMWIDPNDPNHFIVGDDGGVSQTWDRGGNYDFINTFPIGQFYDVSFDMGIPYRVCGGLQDNGSWCGPSRVRQGNINNHMWFVVGGGDGFYTAQDPTDPNIIYAESQGGAIGRLNYATGERVSLRKPSFRERYGMYEDSMVVARGDTTQPATPELTRRLAAIRARQVSDSITEDMRFNWETPYFISPHAPSTLYIGGNRVLKSTDRGDHLMVISPDLSTRDSAKIYISTHTTGGVTPDVTGAETFGTIVSLAESPIRPGLLYAGTDDGNVWLTRNDGGTWENITSHFTGVPKGTYVSRIEPSAFDSSTFYIAFDNHERNDFKPYLFVTNDFGRTFRSIVNNLPSNGIDYVHVVREDPYNRDLLFVGTDIAAYVSIDRGASWQRFMSGMPTVPVHDLKIQPRDHEIIAGTHGRSIWIADIAPLEQMSNPAARGATYLFTPTTAYEFGGPPVGGEETGQQSFQGANEPYGVSIAYRLPAGARDSVRFVITGAAGDTIRTLSAMGRPGINHITWDMRERPKDVVLTPAQRRDSLAMAHRVNFVVDSMIAAGGDRAGLERLRTMFLSGGRGFGGGGFGGGALIAGAPFVERPGESPAPRGGGAGARRGGRGADTTAGRAGAGAVAGAQGAGGRGGAAAGEAPIDPSLFSVVADLVRRPGSLYPPAGRRQAPMVETGDYLVTMIVNGQSYRQTARVVRMPGVGEDTSFGDQTDDDSDHP